MPRETVSDQDGDDGLDLDARETLEADDVPELDAASDDDEMDRALESHASEDIVGDSDGDDYRAGTLDPEGSDRGPPGELSGDLLDGAGARRGERGHGRAP